MSTHRGELDGLIMHLRAGGHKVNVEYCENGYIDTIGLDDKHQMNPLVFAEMVRPMVKIRGLR